MGSSGACSLTLISGPVREPAERLLGLPGIEVAGADEKLNLVIAAELLYSLLGMEYMALEEHNTIPLVKLEVELVEGYVVPLFSRLSECLARITNSELVLSLASLIAEFASVERKIASAQRRAIEEYEASIRGQD